MSRTYISSPLGICMAAAGQLYFFSNLVGLLGQGSDWRKAFTNTGQHNTEKRIHASSVIRTHDPSVRAPRATPKTAERLTSRSIITHSVLSGGYEPKALGYGVLSISLLLLLLQIFSLFHFKASSINILCSHPPFINWPTVSWQLVQHSEGLVVKKCLIRTVWTYSPIFLTCNKCQILSDTPLKALHSKSYLPDKNTYQRWILGTRISLCDRQCAI
jgi:hypothetical protein